MSNDFSSLTEQDFRTTHNLLQYFKIGETRRSNDSFFILCEGGIAEMQVNLDKFIIEENEQLCLFPSDTVTILRCSASFRVHAFVFSEDFMCAAGAKLENVVFRFLHTNYRITVKDEKLKELKKWLEMIENISNNTDPEIRREVVLLQLRCLYLEAYSEGKKWLRKNGVATNDMQSRSSILCHKFIELVIKHCDKEREVQFYAEKLCITPKYLNNVVKYTLQKTAKEYIDERVIVQLKIAIKTTDKSIQEIADDFCFTNQSYLGRYFRRFTGKSISEFRK